MRETFDAKVDLTINCKVFFQDLDSSLRHMYRNASYDISAVFVNPSNHLKSLGFRVINEIALI